MKKPIAAGIGLLAVTMAFAAKDPIIMTINGVDVPKSEFEYLYNKNSQQQITPQSLDEYLEMFKLYKLKVADAKAEGIDTLASFRKEMAQYKKDLAAPYMADSAYLNQLVQEAYDRSRREVEAFHIMAFKGRTPMQEKQARHLIDSLKTVLDNGGDFAQLAEKYSQDRGSSRRGGRMGYIIAGQYPYSFEVVDFSLPEGKISDVVESPVGYHILKGGKSRPARGKIKASHILKLTRGKDEAGKAAAKAAIDSIYAVVVANPEKFAEIARTESEDPGSARQGGELPWFGAGEMVEEFDSAAFSLPKNGISKPVQTSYGYHIIYKTDEQAPKTLAEMKPQLLQQVTNPRDERSKLIREHQTNRFAKKHNAKMNESTVSMLHEYVGKNGLDSLFYTQWLSGSNGNISIAEIDGKKIPAREFAKTLNNVKIPMESAPQSLDRALDNFFSDRVFDAEEDALIQSVPEYRNLLKEYTDGSLLYEVSSRKVWDKASKDEEGLKNYFNTHRADYKWNEPHVKGYFIQTTNDSVAGAIKARAAQLKDDEMVKTLRKEFSGNIMIEKIQIGKGGNPMVDYVAFGGPKVESSMAKYPVYFMVNERILTEPEEVSDVRGQVTSDYQNMNQQKWENELRRKYPVKVNMKVLKSIGKK